MIIKKVTTVFALMLINFQVGAQKIVRTYWDYYHTRLKSEYHTTNDGFNNGPYKVWYSNGILNFKGTMKNDVKEGWSYWYTERGALIQEKLWQQNVLIQEKEHWDIPGTPIRTNEWYVNGRTTEYKEYHKNSKLKVWRKNGLWTILYFSSGKKRAYIPIYTYDQDGHKGTQDDYKNAIYYAEDGITVISEDFGDQ